MIRSNRMYRAMLGASLVVATLVVIQPNGSIVEAQSPDVTTSIIATRKVIVDDADGTGSYIVTGNYFRDRKGRCRIDEGDFAMIADRVLRQTIVLNKRTSKFKRVLWVIVPTGGCDAYACPDSATAYSTSKTDLGTQTINGIACEGTSVTRTIPAFSVPEDGDSFGCLKSLNFGTFCPSAYAEWFYQGCYNLSGTPRNFSTATYWKKSTNNRFVNTPTSIIIH